jgi:pSer/pThr/pTyr-binding forkhead associated (FHA) protein
LITCNRCGKENQDHYKFCLGCGNELAKAVPAAPPPQAAPVAATPAPAPHPAVDSAPADKTPQPLAMARTEFVPAPSRVDPTPPPVAVASGEIRPAVDRQPASIAGAAQKARGGIPWNDSPKMPAQFTPSPIVQTPLQTPPPGSGSFPTAEPPSGGVPRSGPTNGGGTPPIGNSMQAHSAAGTLGSAAASVPPAEVVCVTCGKVIAPGFAFCGSCGTRVAPPATAPPATSGPRTMFMGGPAVAPAATPAPRGRLVLIRPDGSEGGVHALYEGENIIGRGQGALFDSDAYLSPRHGEFLIGPQGVTIRDLRSLNGVFLKISQEEPLESGDIFRIGQELLRFEIISAPQPLEDGTEIMGTPNPGFWGRLSVVVGRDVDGSAFPLFGDAIVLGRERGDVLFPEDGYVSGSHARIAINDGQVYLSDLGSSNGTFLRIRTERPVTAGSFVLMGQQLFRVEIT